MKESSYTPAPVIGGRVKNFIVLGISNIFAVFSACSFLGFLSYFVDIVWHGGASRIYKLKQFCCYTLVRYLFPSVIVLFLSFPSITSFSSLLLS